MTMFLARASLSEISFLCASTTEPAARSIQTPGPNLLSEPFREKLERRRISCERAAQQHLFPPVGGSTDIARQGLALRCERRCRASGTRPPSSQPLEMNSQL